MEESSHVLDSTFPLKPIRQKTRLTWDNQGKSQGCLSITAAGKRSRVVVQTDSRKNQPPPRFEFPLLSFFVRTRHPSLTCSSWAWQVQNRKEILNFACWLLDQRKTVLSFWSDGYGMRSAHTRSLVFSCSPRSIWLDNLPTSNSFPPCLCLQLKDRLHTAKPMLGQLSPSNLTCFQTSVRNEKLRFFQFDLAVTNFRT